VYFPVIAVRISEKILAVPSRHQYQIAWHHIYLRSRKSLSGHANGPELVFTHSSWNRKEYCGPVLIFARTTPNHQLPRPSVVP